MGFRDVLKTGMRPKSWFGWDQHKDNLSALSRLLGFLLCRRAQAQPETFEQALKRLSMTEADLQQRMQNGFWVIAFCLGLAVAMGFYMHFFIMRGQLMPHLTCLMLILVLLTYAVREHFNLYQMRQRRLGCSFREYLKSLLQRGK